MTEVQKVCCRCKIPKDLKEFHKYARSKDGLRGYCKECKASEASAYYDANAESVRRRSSDWYARNTKYANARSSQWRRSNPERVRDNNRRWSSENPISNRNRAAARRSRLAGVFVEYVDALTVFERDAWACGICSELVDSKLQFPDRACATVDHILPLSRGGSHSYDNVQLAHFSCNSGKRDRVEASR